MIRGEDRYQRKEGKVKRETVEEEGSYSEDFETLVFKPIDSWLRSIKKNPSGMTHEAKMLFAKSQNLQMKKGKRGPYKGQWGVEVPDLEDGAYRIKRCHKSGAMATKREAHDNKEQQRIALAEKTG